MRKNTWNNVKGNACWEVDVVGNNWSIKNKLIPNGIVNELKTLFPSEEYESGSFELEIPFLSSGYYDPGVINALPENCYPPEGSDERELKDVITVYFVDEEESRKLSLTASQQLFNLLEEEILEVELEDWDDSPYC